MSEPSEYTLTFDGDDAAEANHLIQALQDEVTQIDPAIRAERRRHIESSQDFGTTLVLVFGTPVAIALAKGIASFLARHSGASLTIHRDGTVMAKNLNSTDAAKIAAALGGKDHS